MLTDDPRVLFVSNENTAVAPTRVWLIPGGECYYGAVHVGLGDGGTQGGINTVLLKAYGPSAARSAISRQRLWSAWSRSRRES